TAPASIASQPLPGLDIASTKGWAKVLRQATVITNNGVEAAFSNGGEQNFTVTTGLGVGIQRIPFGTDLTVLPRYVPQQHQLEVKLNAEVSDLTAAVNGTNLPGRNIAKLATNVSLKLGESIVLSGIRAESTTHTISGIPGLKDIPVLGILFGTHSDATELTEGAIFIVPSVIEPAPNAARELVTNAMRTYRDFSGNMDNLHTYDRTPPVSVGGAPAQK
ncbi:MAG: type II and III secretion system protein, partial [Polyangiaceae bacterium]|nr:type II and III secretion system protein [Polyangiaceae bacterium]